MNKPKYFNSRNLPGTPVKFMESLEKSYTKIAEKFNVKPSEWVSLKALVNQLSRAWGDTYFQNYWVEKLVDDFSIMVWNQVLAVNEGRNAEKVADQAQMEFQKLFK